MRACPLDIEGDLRVDIGPDTVDVRARGDVIEVRLPRLRTAWAAAGTFGDRRRLHLVVRGRRVLGVVPGSRPSLLSRLLGAGDVRLVGPFG